MNLSTIKERWDEEGFVIVRGLFDSARVHELRRICDRILEEWIEESPHPEEAANYTNMAFLTEPRYFERHRDELEILLEAITEARVLRVLKGITGPRPLFHNTQYFFEPASQTKCGDWHRDQQFDAPDEETERARMRELTGVHVHIPFLPDDNLEIVAGSHARWDTTEELGIRRGLDGAKKNSDHMPGARRICLEAGDAVFFSAWAIHRGNYIAGTPRRTLVLIYGTGPGWTTPPPTGFLEKGIPEGLSRRAQTIFRRFIETYEEKWLRGEYDT